MVTFPLTVKAPTGVATLEAKILRSDGLFLDFADGAFKAAGHTTPAAAMAELDAAAFPGLYQLSVDPAAGPGWTDGRYVACVFDTAGDEAFDPVELVVLAEQLVDELRQVTPCASLATSDAGALEIIAWLLVGGQIHAAPTSVAVSIYEADGTLALGPLASSSPSAQGVFKLSAAAPTLAADVNHYAEVTIVAGGTSYTAPAAFAIYD